MGISAPGNLFKGRRSLRPLIFFIGGGGGGGGGGGAYLNLVGSTQYLLFVLYTDFHEGVLAFQMFIIIVMMLSEQTSGILVKNDIFLIPGPGHVLEAVSPINIVIQTFWLQARNRIL